MNGAAWVSVHHGGGVGMGLSIHAGLAVLVDGTKDARPKIERCLTGDPGMGMVRHADAGYPLAIDAARRDGMRIPMLDRADTTDPARHAAPSARRPHRHQLRRAASHSRRGTERPATGAELRDLAIVTGGAFAAHRAGVRGGGAARRACCAR